MSKRRRSVKTFCHVCGNEFAAGAYGAKFCTNACKMKDYRSRKGNEKADKAVNKTPAGRANNLEKWGIKSLKSCPHCGKRFTFKRSDQVFCSASCRVVASRNKQHRTISKIIAESGAKPFDLYQMVEIDGWKSLYEWLEKKGFVWSPTRELWLNNLTNELAKLL